MILNCPHCRNDFIPYDVTIYIRYKGHFQPTCPNCHKEIYVEKEASTYLVYKEKPSSTNTELQESPLRKAYKLFRVKEPIQETHQENMKRGVKDE